MRAFSKISLSAGALVAVSTLLRALLLRIDVGVHAGDETQLGHRVWLVDKLVGDDFGLSLWSLSLASENNSVFDSAISLVSLAEALISLLAGSTVLADALLGMSIVSRATIALALLVSDKNCRSGIP